MTHRFGRWFWLGTTLALGLASCTPSAPPTATPGPAPTPGSTATPQTTQSPTPSVTGAAEIRASYRCGNGARLEAVFKDNKVVLTLPDKTLTLPQSESGSGARYSDGITTFWIKGQEGFVEVDGETRYPNCVANDAPATSGRPPQVEEFPAEDVRASSCSMTLVRADRPTAGRIVFFSTQIPETAQLTINGQSRLLQRVQVSGQPIQGQFTTQTFASPDNSLRVTADVRPADGAASKAGAVPVVGTLKAVLNQQETVLQVKGESGC